MRRTGVALALIVLASGCGGAAETRTQSTKSASSATTATKAPQEQGALRLASVEKPPYAVTLYGHAVGGPDCFSADLRGVDDLFPLARVSGQSCIGDRPWHVRVATGGEPGSVDWSLVVAAARGHVARVDVISASGARREVELRPVSGAPWRTGGLRLDEGVTTVEARTSGGVLIESLDIPDQGVGSCDDWICKGQGPWAAELDAHSPNDIPPEAPDPEQAILAADDRLRALFSGTRFDLSFGLHWRDCAGIRRGWTWAFRPRDEAKVDLDRWPTLDRGGEPIAIEGRGPTDLVVVDLDVDRKRVISILPYYSSEQVPWVGGSEQPEAPLAGGDCRDLD